MFPSCCFSDESIYLFNYFFSCDSNWVVSKKWYIKKRVEKRMVVDWLYLVLPYLVCVSFRWRGSLVRGCAQLTDWKASNSKKKGSPPYTLPPSSPANPVAIRINSIKNVSICFCILVNLQYLSTKMVEFWMWRIHYWSLKMRSTCIRFLCTTRCTNSSVRNFLCAKFARSSDGERVELFPFTHIIEIFTLIFLLSFSWSVSLERISFNCTCSGWSQCFLLGVISR